MGYLATSDGVRPPDSDVAVHFEAACATGYDRAVASVASNIFSEIYIDIFRLSLFVEDDLYFLMVLMV